jgi:AcrR family transcriptional regulator
MGPKERRTREREDTKSRILDAARDMFVQDGIEAVTMREIAKRIEYTPTAIYHHFRDKQALIEELCRLDFQALAGAFQKIGRIEDPMERLRRIGLAYVDYGLDHPSHYRFMFMTPKPPLAADVLGIQDGEPGSHAYGMLRATVAEGIAAGRFRPEFTDADELAQVLWAGVHGIVSLHIVKGGKGDHIAWADPRETARAILDVQMRGTIRGPTESPRA